MSWSRRDVLGSLGIASTHALLFGFSGCRAPAAEVRAPRASSGEVRTWLRDAVAVLRGAGHAQVHALAVSRRRTTAAIDGLGTGVARARCDAVVLSVYDGTYREQVTSDLSADGVAAAARALAGGSRSASVDFGPAPAPIAAMRNDPERLDDAALLARVEALARHGAAASSRIVYAAAWLDLDDATRWSVAPGRDQVQRAVRVRRAVARIAWNGTRPVIGEAARGWIGGLDDQTLSEAELDGARDAALALMTPGAFEGGERAVVLDPSIAAQVIDAAVRGMMTGAAARRPEVARRVAIGAQLAAPAMTIVDDPTVAGAYGGFAFDDEGEPAAAITLVDRGTVVARLGDRASVAAGLAAAAGRGMRPGHVGCVAPMPSHVRIAPGAARASDLIDSGFVLEGGLGVVVDPASDRVVIACARARELAAGRPTGRQFADVELVGELAPLLATVTAGSSETRTTSLRDELDGQPRWRSIEAPWLRARGLLRARRSAG